jgi:hypothetical protein
MMTNAELADIRTSQMAKRKPLGQLVFAKKGRSWVAGGYRIDRYAGRYWFRDPDGLVAGGQVVGGSGRTHEEMMEEMAEMVHNHWSGFSVEGALFWHSREAASELARIRN